MTETNLAAQAEQKKYTKDNPLRVISLGAGVQSTAMLLMSLKGDLPRADAAVFSDVGWEPAAVYKHLDWLEKEVAPFPIYRVQYGNLREDLLRSASEKKRVSNPPLRTMNRETGKRGLLIRACTRDYKIFPVERQIRKLLGVKRILSKEQIVESWLGISTDEASRMKPSRNRWSVNRFPLIEADMSRNDCLTWLRDNGYPDPWATLTPDEVLDAIEVDNAIREGIYTANDYLFLHRTWRPLEEALANPVNLGSGADEECDGVCFL